MGTPRERGAIARLLRPALPQRLLRALPGIDLRIVADRTLAPERTAPPKPTPERPARTRLREPTGAGTADATVEPIAGRRERGAADRRREPVAEQLPREGGR
jgi:hypothetical protein